MEIYGSKESKSERDKAKELMGVLKRERVGGKLKRVPERETKEVVCLSE